MKIIEPIWYQKNKAVLLSLDSFVKNELFAQNSLTTEISNVGTFSVSVIEQKNTNISLSETLSLDVFPQALANIRNVVLSCDGVPVIFARTVLPLCHLKRGALRFTKLGNKSLGSVLYAERTTIKQPTEVAIFTPKHFLFNYMQNYCKLKLGARVCARRSVFILNFHPLLVNEIYLPAYWEKIYCI